ncbi:MAG: hypothetical protein ACRDG7_01760 [Candidatus Limnocylindria bacterium]
MTPVEWPALARALAWIMAAAFAIGSVLLALLAFDVFGAPPAPQQDFIDTVVAEFAWLESLWPIEFVGTALFALGFLVLGGLGPALSRLAGPTDARGGLVSAALIGAGGLGAASQLVWLGARPVATSSEYCECGLEAEEVMSRLGVLGAAAEIQVWLVTGALLAGAVGFMVAGRLGREAGMPAGWWWLSVVTAVLALAVVLLVVGDAFPINVLVTVLVAGILVPIWALWLATRAWDIWPRSEAFAGTT